MTLKPPKRRVNVLKYTGVVLIIVSIAFGFFWFLKLLPFVKRVGTNWEEQFTPRAAWREVQAGIRGLGWTHDDFGLVGIWGDKSWIEWIIDKAKLGVILSGCTAGHIDDALEHITCQRPIGGTPEAAWIEWWEKNKNKSQIEWIRDGLSQRGVTVHIPPTKEEYEPLLISLGDTAADGTHRHPAFVRYNAFRWLRDSGFDMIAFAVSKNSSHTSAKVLAGLYEFARMDRQMPSTHGLGILPLQERNEYPRAEYRLRVYYHIGAFTLIICPLLFGILLLIRAQKADSEISAPPTEDKQRSP